MRNISDMQVGERVYFADEGVTTMEIRAKKGNYMVAVETDGSRSYTILDTERGMCGPHDRTFNPYDFKTQAGIDECLSDMISGKYGIKLSGRHSAEFNEVLDLERSLT